MDQQLLDKIEAYRAKGFEVPDEDMIKTPDCSYALFVKEKFPAVWRQYEKENG